MPPATSSATRRSPAAFMFKGLFTYSAASGQSRFAWISAVAIQQAGAEPISAGKRRDAAALKLSSRATASSSALARETPVIGRWHSAASAPCGCARRVPFTGSK